MSELALAAAIVGAFQWVALRRVIHGAWRWIPATAVGFFLLPSAALVPDLPDPRIETAARLVLVLLGLLAPSVAQYRVLLTELGGAGHWVFTSLVGLFLFAASASPWQWPYSAAPTAMGTLLYSALTGWTLYRLTRFRAEMAAERQQPADA